MQFLQIKRLCYVLMQCHIIWGKMWQKPWGNREGNSHLHVLSGRGSGVGVRADGRCGVQVISADVIQGVTEAAAYRAAVIPAKGKTGSSNELSTRGKMQKSPTLSFNMCHALGREFLFF